MPDSANAAVRSDILSSDVALFRVFEAASAGVAVYTCAGRLVYTNEAMLSLTGQRAEALGSFYSGAECYSGARAEEVALFNAVAGGDRALGSVRLRLSRPDGSCLFVRSDMYTIQDIQTNRRLVVRQMHELADVCTPAAVVGGTRRDKAYMALQLLTQVILREFTLIGLMEGIHGVLSDLMAAESCSIALTDGPGSSISFPYFCDIKRKAPGTRPFGNGLTEFVYVWGKPFMLKQEDILGMESKGVVCPAQPRPAVWLGVPLRTHAGESVGVLSVRSYSDGDAFTSDDLQLLELISGYVGGAIETFRQQEALRDSEARFRAVFEHSGLGVCTVTAEQRIIESNGRVADMFDTDGGSLLHADLLQFIVDASARKEVLRRYAALMEGAADSFSEIVECRLPGAARFWCRMTFTAVRDGHGEFSFSVVLLEDVTEHKLSDDRLMHMAFHDALTSLPNRTLFMDRLNSAIRRSRRHEGYHFAVLFMDMDRFKVVNDSMGHEAGDELLKQFALRVNGCLRESDTFARFGGDEFAVLMDDLQDVLQATHVIQRILESLKAPFKVGGVEVFSGASVGAVLRANEYERSEDILRDADAAMYRAKENGSGRYEIFDRTLHSRMQDMLQLENAIRRGLEFSEFQPVFQPYVTLQTGRVRGAEVLARWKQPAGDIVSPEHFISAAEESGLIYGLDCQMLEYGCAAMTEWRAQNPDAGSFVLNLNVSAITMQRWNMLDVFMKIIADSGCRPSDICLEITENTLLKGEEAVTDRLWKLRDNGVRIALDDFGTGYSSFNYLRNFPVNMIKVDKSFTASVLDDRATHGIVQAIVSLGRGLGIEVVAEGVETFDQAQMLASLGCEAAQGYLFSRPVGRDRLYRAMEYGKLPMEAG
ncbi:EAL domain-containing protein [Desulfovibrio mangrovi]|uniref:bifunctional diguanylate cyclase/phosphodiesterase n=1 Tax=Desulfovibrio mangrovi TaxID=2976983 RepID=UPI0022455F4C|nr:EAL domain-containing protein [Desulfovibrio mangrovi]UZP67909.1 EAL domain-containing protein [Desulfovibrio mangrovi]